MRVATDVQASFGSCCSCAAVETAVDSSAEAKAAVTDATVSGSSYSFCAAAAMTTASAASDHKIGFPDKKGRNSCLFCYCLSLFCGCLSRSFDIRMSRFSGALTFFLFRCRHASSSSYTRFPSMINRPMDFLLIKKVSLYIICIF